MTTLLLHLETDPPLDHPALPRALRPVLARCLAKSPAARFASARELVEALDSARRGEGASPRRPRAWSSAMLGLGAALLAVAAGIALVGHWLEPAATPPSAEAPLTSVATSLPEPPPTESPVSSPPVRTDHRPEATPRPAPPTPTPMPTEAPPATTLAAPPTAAPVPTSTPSPSPVASVEGHLLVVVRPWANVSVDSVLVGQTPLKAFPLPPGPHAVLLAHPDYQPYPRRVTIRAGETFRLEVDLRSDGVRRSP